ncbi:MAG: hypothetical protein ABL999_09000 [Pyrinomonadaceae bacterium]
MLNIIVLTFFLAFFSFSPGLFAQATMPVSGAGATKIMPISEVREGMRGTARTVFQGNRSEEFGVEILGVVPNWIGPRQDIIVGKLSGANAERTFVFAGMSGSPVYVDGKLIGAISYSFPFAKEPICGITPFEQMSSVMEQAIAAKPSNGTAKTFTYAELQADKWKPSFSEIARTPAASGFSSDSKLMAIAGQTFTPISTPLYFSGISQQTLDTFAPELMRAGIMPVATAGGGSTIKPLVPYNEKTLLGGDSVVVSLARGDVQIAAAGTVTLRDGEKIYAFGHPFFSLGSANLPMAESHVVTVIPNANNSFKLAVPDATVGAMTQDRATAVYGKLGAEPKMLPVRVKLINSRGRISEINFESAFDELLTPLIVNAGIGNTLAAQERGLGDTTIEMTGEIKIKGEDSIRLNRRFAGAQATALAAAAAAIPLSALLRANFDGLDITGIEIRMTARDGSRTGLVDRISVNKNMVKAGETIDLTVFERTESGQFNARKVPVTIPVDAAPGTVTLTVGDGNAVQQNAAITQFTPKNAAELISTINRLKRSDRLYVVLSRTSTGTIIGSSEMPNLPPSMLATLNNDRTAGGSKPSVLTTIAEMELSAGEFVISGSQTLNIEVVR